MSLFICMIVCVRSCAFFYCVTHQSFSEGIAMGWVEGFLYQFEENVLFPVRRTPSIGSVFLRVQRRMRPWLS